MFKTELSVTNTLWKLQEVNQREILTLMQNFRLPEILARILVTRNIGIKNVEDFFHPLIRSSLPDPFHLLDMDKAVSRTINAIYNNENIVIYGDYDVDGATSSALIRKYLLAIGINAKIYIPNRIDEGYGLNSNALLKLKKNGMNLCIAVDCGTLAYQPIEDAKNFNLDVIVIDHHLSVEKLPNAVAIVNPNRIDETSPYNNLAAVGVSFLFVVALNKSLRDKKFFKGAEPNLFSFLDLVALGTVCDVMQITGLNRAFVSQGLKVMSARENIGLRVLHDTLGILEKLNVYQLGFSIGPCINAGGRVGESSLGARLLSTSNEEEALSIALKLIDLNNARKSLENEALEQACSQTEKLCGVNFIMVIGDWHQGIIGILASRLKEQFFLPTIVISVDKKGIGKASCRSIPGVDIGAAVLSAKFSGLIIEGGGHYMAAGFSVEESKIKDLQEFFTCQFSNIVSQKVIKADGIISVKTVSIPLLQQLERLEPFGVGNPEPRFIIQGVKIRKPEIIGNNHIKCFITDDDARVKGIAFRSADTKLGSALMQGNIKAVIGKMSSNYWNGSRFAQFVIEDALSFQSIH